MCTEETLAATCTIWSCEVAKAAIGGSGRHAGSIGQQQQSAMLAPKPGPRTQHSLLQTAKV